MFFRVPRCSSVICGEIVQNDLQGVVRNFVIGVAGVDEDLKASAAQVLQGGLDRRTEMIAISVAVATTVILVEYLILGPAGPIRGHDIHFKIVRRMNQRPVIVLRGPVAQFRIERQNAGDG